MNIQFITNEHGARQSVIMPYIDWLKINKLLANESVVLLLEEIEKGLKQVKLIKEGKLPKKTFKQLLNEK